MNNVDWTSVGRGWGTNVGRGTYVASAHIGPGVEGIDRPNLT